MPEELGPLDADMKAIIKKAAIRHWGTKQRSWLGENTEEGEQRVARKQSKGTTYSRLRRVSS